MNMLDLGKKMVEQVNEGRESEQQFVNEYYSEDIISIEGLGVDESHGRLEGIEAIREKHNWWYDNNDVHSTVASGPYIGERNDQFIIRFVLDMTPKNGERMIMDEVAIFTVEDGKISEEAYLYLMG
ncbi:MAG: hypothetical protein ACI9FB_000167 [Candidatus Azotimanducaceae bacterium]|jgi:hypothetical protein